MRNMCSSLGKWKKRRRRGTEKAHSNNVKNTWVIVECHEWQLARPRANVVHSDISICTPHVGTYLLGNMVTYIRNWGVTRSHASRDGCSFWIFPCDVQERTSGKIKMNNRPWEKGGKIERSDWHRQPYVTIIFDRNSIVSCAFFLDHLNPEQCRMSTEGRLLWWIWSARYFAPTAGALSPYFTLLFFEFPWAILITDTGQQLHKFCSSVHSLRDNLSRYIAHTKVR